jgi:roadblock/LC7 domain-containing protein
MDKKFKEGDYVKIIKDNAGMPSFPTIDCTNKIGQIKASQYTYDQMYAVRFTPEMMYMYASSSFTLVDMTKLSKLEKLIYNIE